MPSPPLPLVQSLSPRVAVLTSDDVIESCEANGCRGLEELLRPWEGGAERVSILSSTLTPGIHPTFPLRFVSFASVFPNPASSSVSPEMVVDQIGSLVAARRPDEEQHYPLTRSLLLSSRPVTSHETFNHPVCTILAVSTAEPDALGTLQKLHGRAIGPMAQAVPWMDGVNVMRFYVVVHDISKMGEDLAPAHELLAGVKKAYGPHSTSLVINSQVERRSPPPSPNVTTHPSIPLPRPFTPDNADASGLSQVYASALSSLTLSPLTNVAESTSPSKPARRKLYGAKLSGEDTQRLAALVRELVGQSLVPWMEARVREWNEIYHANKRGITGRLFGAGRKLFGSRPASPAPNSINAGYNAVKGYYPVTTIEALARRLADFAFMLRDYKYASTIYDSLRRDFAQDRATRYAAAATEMYGLSLLLSHPYFLPSTPPKPPVNPFTTLAHTDISSWLEQAVVAYQSRSPANQIQLDALRITVLYYEAWKMVGEWRGVGPALVRAAGEADEVPSAVMIEEAAAADISGGKSERGRRRRAFNLVTAARRYETAGLKTYSRRCLDRASGIYRSAPWTAAQDRIEYSLGRQAYTLGESDVAVEHFLRLLRREDTGVTGSQGMVLEDMALAYEQLKAHPEMLEKSEGRLQLPTPVFDIKSTRILGSSNGASTSGTSERWSELETAVLSKWDRKGKKPMSLLRDSKKVVVAVDERFEVELVATNPLNAPLVLTDLTLLVDSPDQLEIETIPEISLEPYETRTITVGVSPRQTKPVTITHASFLFHRFFPVKQALSRRGKRLHTTKAQRLEPTYGSDTSLLVEVAAAAPRLKLEFEGWPEEVFEGEEVRLSLRMENVGTVAVEDVRLLASEIGMLRTNDHEDTPHGYTTVSIPNILSANPAMVLRSEPLQPGQITTLPLLLTGTYIGNAELLALAIFSNAEVPDDVAVTTLSQRLSVHPLGSLSTQVRPSHSGPAEYLVGLNIEASETVIINDILAFGPYWHAGPSRASLPASLPSNQTFRTFMSLSPTSSQISDLRQEAVVKNLAKLVQNQPDQITTVEHPPLSVNAPLSAAYLASRHRHRLQKLRSDFPTIPPDDLPRIFPLFDPLDLDISVSWSLPDQPLRKGMLYLHGSRVSPDFSHVEEVRREVDKAIFEGGKQTRTMYEETGRLRRVLMDSVLDGVLGKEEDPLQVRVRVPDGGQLEHDFADGARTVKVEFQLRNRSPLLPVRYILRLPQQTAEHTNLGTPHFVGSLEYRGMIRAGDAASVESAIWVSEPGMVRLRGWEVEVETGEVDESAEDGGAGEQSGWRARYSWRKVGQGGMLEVRQG